VSSDNQKPATRLQTKHTHHLKAGGGHQIIRNAPSGSKRSIRTYCECKSVIGPSETRHKAPNEACAPPESRRRSSDNQKRAIRLQTKHTHILKLGGGHQTVRNAPSGSKRSIRTSYECKSVTRQSETLHEAPNEASAPAESRRRSSDRQKRAIRLQTKHTHTLKVGGGHQTVRNAPSGSKRSVRTS
jgi:hypothetical protein